MDKPLRTRRDPRKEATQLLLIEEAERLFGQHGVEGVSLREIGAAAGCGNTSVVRYHFGSRDGLLQAIFERRLADIEAGRAEALARLHAAERADEVRGLMDALCRPVADQVDRNGRHTYAAFLVGLQRFRQMGWRSLHQVPTPATDEIVSRLRAAAPPMPAEVLKQRVLVTSMMVIEALADSQPQSGEEVAQSAFAEFDDLVTMAAGALTAPYQGVL